MTANDIYDFLNLFLMIECASALVFLGSVATVTLMDIVPKLIHKQVQKLLGNASDEKGS